MYTETKGPFEYAYIAALIVSYRRNSGRILGRDYMFEERDRAFYEGAPAKGAVR